MENLTDREKELIAFIKKEIYHELDTAVITSIIEGDKKKLTMDEFYESFPFMKVINPD
jgi:hypothetical protein